MTDSKRHSNDGEVRDLVREIAVQMRHISRGCRSERSHNPQPYEDASAIAVNRLANLARGRDRLYEQFEAAQGLLVGLVNWSPQTQRVREAMHPEHRAVLEAAEVFVSNPATTLGNGDLVKPSKADSDVCHNASNPASTLTRERDETA